MGILIDILKVGEISVLLQMEAPGTCSQWPGQFLVPGAWSRHYGRGWQHHGHRHPAGDVQHRALAGLQDPGQWHQGLGRGWQTDVWLYGKWRKFFTPTGAQGMLMFVCVKKVFQEHLILIFLAQIWKQTSSWIHTKFKQSSRSLLKGISTFLGSNIKKHCI